jgi:DNA polymerase III delta prime subunit
VVYGREDIVGHIENYVKSDIQCPTCLVLVGYPGTGKSALIALAAKLFTGADTSVECQVCTAT